MDKSNLTCMLDKIERKRVDFTVERACSNFVFGMLHHLSPRFQTFSGREYPWLCPLPFLPFCAQLKTQIRQGPGTKYSHHTICHKDILASRLLCPIIPREGRSLNSIEN